jgi:hypothetical protein
MSQLEISKEVQDALNYLAALERNEQEEEKRNAEMFMDWKVIMATVQEEWNACTVEEGQYARAIGRTVHRHEREMQ